jgi:hypothetical protein
MQSQELGVTQVSANAVSLKLPVNSGCRTGTTLHGRALLNLSAKRTRNFKWSFKKNF